MSVIINTIRRTFDFSNFFFSGACDEIKEFSHEGDLDLGKNSDFREIKTILGLSADSQPLPLTLEVSVTI